MKRTNNEMSSQVTLNFITVCGSNAQGVNVYFIKLRACKYLIFKINGNTIIISNSHIFL